MTITVSVTILPDESSAPAPAPAAALRFDGSRLKKIAEIAAKVAELLADLGILKSPPTVPPAANL